MFHNLSPATTQYVYFCKINLHNKTRKQSHRVVDSRTFFSSCYYKYTMGCGASNRSAVVPVEELASDSESPNKKTHIRRSSDVIAVKGDDIPAEELKDSKSPGMIAQPLAFEVPVNEESIIRKHPPKRLQRLEDQQVPLTHELLDEKQAEAEQRRLQILTQRIQSAKQRAPRRPFLDDDSESPSEMIETIKRENSTIEL